MKIAMFTDAYFPRINGVTTSVKSYAQELTRIGHEVCVVCMEYSEEQQQIAQFDIETEDKKSPFRIVRIPSMGLIFSKEDRAARLDQWKFVKQQMKAFRPDVIHINGEWVVGYFGATFALHYGVAFVFTFHTLWEHYIANYVKMVPKQLSQKIGRDIVKFYLKRATFIIAPTERIKQVVYDYKIERAVDLLPTGISSDIFKFSEERSAAIRKKLFAEQPQLAGKKILLYVGRIAKEKNLAFLLYVLKNVVQTNPQTALAFIGGGPYVEELQELAREMNLSENTAFTGYVAREDLVYYYKLANIFTFPSLTETQGLVTIEAMLGGLPVVAVGAQGTLDVMQGDHGGFMVENNVEEFAKKTRLLLCDEELCRQKAREAAEWGKQWSIEALTPKLVEFYRKAIEIKAREKARAESERAFAEGAS